MPWRHHPSRPSRAATVKCSGPVGAVLRGLGACKAKGALAGHRGFEVAGSDIGSGAGRAGVVGLVSGRSIARLDPLLGTKVGGCRQVQAARCACLALPFRRQSA